MQKHFIPFSLSKILFGFLLATTMLSEDSFAPSSRRSSTSKKSVRSRSKKKIKKSFANVESAPIVVDSSPIKDLPEAVLPLSAKIESPEKQAASVVQQSDTPNENEGLLRKSWSHLSRNKGKYLVAAGLVGAAGLGGAGYVAPLLMDFVSSKWFGKKAENSETTSTPVPTTQPVIDELSPLEIPSTNTNKNIEEKPVIPQERQIEISPTSFDDDIPTLNPAQETPSLQEMGHYLKATGGEFMEKAKDLKNKAKESLFSGNPDQTSPSEWS